MTMHPRPPRRAELGFSLVEALVSLVVISVGMIGMAALYGQGLGAGRTAMYRTIAVNLAADMADRIRVNRLAGAAYGGTAATADGCGPDSDGCTPAEMAASDLFIWNEQIGAQLPAASGTVAFAAGDPATFTITVTWQETGLGPVSYESVIQIPDF
jgi:type IV pilus assembly protein PilV